LKKGLDGSFKGIWEDWRPLMESYFWLHQKEVPLSGFGGEFLILSPFIFGGILPADGERNKW